MTFTRPLSRWRSTLALGMLAASCTAFAADSAAPVALGFSSFFKHPVGARGLELGEALRAADGRHVTLTGYMVHQEEAQPGRFLLTPRPVRMSEHADGDADDLPPATISVLLDATQRDRVVAHRAGLVALTGRLEVGRFEDADGRVSWVRLHLPAEATAEAAVSAQSRPVAHAH